MILAEQFEIDFERPVNPRADEIAREARNWTPEDLCILWACLGQDDRVWWDNLQSYERRGWLNRYEAELEHANLVGRPMRSPGQILAAEAEHHQQQRSLAERWAVELRTAFLRGKPCPIRPTLEHRGTLTEAFVLAGVNPASLTESEVAA